MPTLQQSTQFLRTKYFVFVLAALGALLLLLLPRPVRDYGLLGALGLAGVAATLVAAMVHPLLMLSLYFGALFFAETRLPGLPVSANQVLALLFFVSWGSYWVRGKTLAAQWSFLPLLTLVAAYFAVSAITGEDFARGSLHFRYVVIYFALALCVASSLPTERAVLALAWIVTGLTFVAACGGLVEAIQKDVLSAFAGRWTNEIRVKGMARNSIVFGWNMVYAFPFAFYLFSELRSTLLRFLALALGFFILFIAVLTFNRQTFVTIGILLFLCGLLFAYQNRKLFGAVLVAAALGGAVSVLPKVLARIFTVTQLSGDWSFLERRDQFLLGMEMFHRHPWFGVGLGSFPAVWRNYIPPDFTTYFAQYQESTMLKFPDFGYMALLAETGMVGLALFAVVLLVMLWKAWSMRSAAARREDRFAYNLAALVLTLTLFLAITSAIQDTFLYVRTWMIFGLTLLLDERVLGRSSVEQASAP